MRKRGDVAGCNPLADDEVRAAVRFHHEQRRLIDLPASTVRPIRSLQRPKQLLNLFPAHLQRQCGRGRGSCWRTRERSELVAQLGT